ncbi:MAG: hypothetical protein WCT50_03520 [Patescibacteria group bacterium]
MLGKSSQKNNKIDEVVINKVDQDLIVHNMPSQSVFKVAPVSKSASSSQFLSAVDKKNNFKAVGGLIIGGGIILVGTLIYLSYYFIIKPKITTPNVVSVVPATNIEPVKEIEVVAVATTTESTTTPLAEVDPNILNLENSSSASSTASSTELITTDEEFLKMPPLLDTDLDGLTDDEEAILGTNPALTDSDSDGYADLSELQNGYSPNAANKKFYPNEVTTKYDNKVGKYSLYYPESWGLKSLNNGYTVIISMPDNSLIQISVSGNPNIQNILTWYEATFSGETVANDRLKSSGNWEGILGTDGLNFYLTGKDRENIYVVSYIPSISGRVAYPNIFKLIINSLVLN